MCRDFLGEGRPPAGERPKGVLGGRGRRIEWAWTESGAACEQTAIGEVLEGFAQRSRCAHNNLLQGDHRHGARLHRRIPRDFELADHLDGTVCGLRDRRRLARQHRPGGDFGVDGVGLASGPPRTSVTPIHFYDPMPRSAHRAGQAGTIAPGTFDAERLDRSVYLGPRDQA